MAMIRKARILSMLPRAQNLLLRKTCQQACVYTIPDYEDKNFTLKKLTLWLSQPFEFYIDEKMLKHQEDLRERYKLRKMQKFNNYTDLGDELNAAFFFVSNGGAVKLNSSDDWHRTSASGYHTLPMENRNDEHFVTGIRLQNMPLLYEGMEFLGRLRSVFYLDVKNNLYFDDFCMSKLYVLSETLEFLDLSGCPKITDLGLQCIHQLKCLKMLRIDNLPGVKNKQYIAFLLEELLPDCVILGVEPLPNLEGESQLTIETANIVDLNSTDILNESVSQGDMCDNQHYVHSDSPQEKKEHKIIEKFTLDDILVEASKEVKEAKKQDS